MAADVVFTDGTNALTLNIDVWDYDIMRSPSEFSMKSIPSIGEPKTIATDFGSYIENYAFQGWMTSRATVKTIQSYSKKEWFESGKGNPLTITIPALPGGDDDAIEVKPAGSNASPLVTYLRAWQDLEQMGIGLYRFEIRVGVVRRL